MIEKLMQRYPQLKRCESEIARAIEMMLDTYRRGGKIMVCGNGGSAADADHIVGDLMKGFLHRRPVNDSAAEKFREALGEASDDYIKKLQCGIPAISLPAQSAVLSAFANDVEPSLVYAQLTYALGRPGDVFMGISTSGNSKNVVEAAEVARRLGLVTIALTGASGGKLADICHVTIRVPENETYLVQELHLPVYHAICAEVEERLFG